MEIITYTCALCLAAFGIFLSLAGACIAEISQPICTAIGGLLIIIASWMVLSAGTIILWLTFAPHPFGGY